jgi:hypothetical protein
LKDVGTPTYHHGRDFYHDSDGTLIWGAHLYVSKMLTNYETMFVFKPKYLATPKIKKYLYATSDLLDALGINHYQSLI